MRGEPYAFGEDDSGTVRVDAAGDVVPLGIDGLEEAVRLSSGDFALRTEEELVILREGEIEARIDCSLCVSIAAVGDWVATLQQEIGVDDGFDIVVYDSALDELGRATAAYADGGTSTVDGYDYRIPTITAVTRDGYLAIAYLGRDGGVRRGPTVVATYSVDGALHASATVEGYIDDSLANADATRLAIVGHGSGGACRSYEYLSALDLPDLRTVDAVDVLVGDERADEDSPIYIVDDLAWDGGVLSATVTRGFGSESGCELEYVNRRVTFDAGAGFTASTALEAGRLPRTLGVLGSACNVPIVYDPVLSEYFLGSDPVPDGVTLTHAPTVAECRG